MDGVEHEVGVPGGAVVQECLVGVNEAGTFLSCEGDEVAAALRVLGGVGCRGRLGVLREDDGGDRGEARLDLGAPGVILGDEGCGAICRSRRA